MSSTNACLACRKVKTKCRVSELGSPCERCARKSVECIFRKHRRGRKPGPRQAISRTALDVADASPPVFSQRPNQPVVVADPPLRGIQTSDPPRNALDNLQPSGVLNHEAMRGQFSLRCVLGVGDGEGQRTGSEALMNPTEDPIENGTINLSVAKSLFHSFMTTLNPYISQLDPELHTFTYVRQKSSFLLSAVIAMSAKAFHPALYPRLYDHAQNLFTAAFRQGTKSVEVVQAILILTYWKEPQDNRVWNSVGYVIRLCIDMNWHKLNPYLSREDNSNSETETRKLRNIERTWYVLFVYDRSISLQTGKPWMIDCDDFIESIEAWCQDPLATENDCLLGALVTIRLLTSTTFSLLVPRGRRREKLDLNDIRPPLTLLSRHLETWETRWIRLAMSSSGPAEDSCHTFLIRFYGTHCRLQLFSLPLQEILTSDRPDGSNFDTLWDAYSSALRMLHLVSQFSNHVSFAQDSVHIMTAYSAALLAKLVLQAPRTIGQELLPEAVRALQHAVTAFSAQAEATGTSCALQVKFLSRIIGKITGSSDQNTALRGGHSGSTPISLHTRTRPLDVDESRKQITGNETSSTAIVPESELNLLFFEREGWDDIFASAGLSVDDSIFLT